MWQSFVCAMTAAVALQAFDPFRSGKLVLYQVTYSNDWHGFEIIPFVLLGIFGVSNTSSYPPTSLISSRASMAACS
jgi:H+/Cl- antiporter ClcA